MRRSLTLVLFTLFLVGCNQDYYANTELYIEENKIQIEEECPTDLETGFARGDGSAGDPFQICKVEHLDSLRDKLTMPVKVQEDGTTVFDAESDQYDDYFDKHYILTENIDLSEGGTFYPIGDINQIQIVDNVTAPNDRPFQGEFDGNGNTILNLYIVNSNVSFVGLFQHLGDKAYVHDFSIDGLFNITGYGAFVGGIAGYSLGKIENIDISMNIAGNNGINIGGVVGYQKGGEISGINVFGSVKYIGTNSDIGGVVGFVEDTVDLYNITSTVAVTGDGYVGGVAGSAKKLINFDTITTQGTVTTYGGEFSGGIVGFAEEGLSLIDLTFSGKVMATGDHSGGIAGWIADAVITDVDCIGGTVEGADFVSPLFADGAILTVNTVTSNCNLTSTGSYQGGIFGRVLDQSSVNVATVNLNVSDGKVYIGGVAGFAQDDFVATNINTTVNLKGTQMVGGVIGQSYNGLTLQNAVVISNTIEGDYNVGGAVGFAREGSLIENVSVNSNITGTDSVGGIVGYAKVTISPTSKPVVDIFNSNFGGTISGRNFIGGILGNGVDGVILDTLYASTDVNCTGFSCGGIAGAIFNDDPLYQDVPYSNSSTVENITHSHNVSGKQVVGGIVGSADRNVSIADVSNSGSVSALQGGAGGLAGRVTYNSSVIESTFTGSVDGNGTAVGGIAGTLEHSSTIRDITGLNSVNVSGTGRVGGVVGYVKESSIAQVQFNGTISATSTPLGGIVGYSDSAAIYNTSFRGSLLGDAAASSAVGGIVGYSDYLVLRYSYSVILSATGVSIDPMVGDKINTVNTNNTTYYDKDLSGIPSSSYATGLTSAQMFLHSNYVGFDFQETWDLPSSGVYPQLK